MSRWYSWQSIPAMAEYFDFSVPEMTATLEQLGLRDRNTKIVKERAYADGLARKVTSGDLDQYTNTQWNALAIDAMLRKVYPKDETWAEMASRRDEEEAIKPMIEYGKAVSNYGEAGANALAWLKSRRGY